MTRPATMSENIEISLLAAHTTLGSVGKVVIGARTPGE